MPLNDSELPLQDLNNTGTCACCGGKEGHVLNDMVVRTRPVRIASKFHIDFGAPNTVMLCTGCLRGMPFNIDALVGMVDMEVDARIADDVLLESFLRKYISEVWPEDTPPSYQHLCKVLNAVGVKTPRGAKWEYHNLQQRMARLDIDREEICRQRADSTFADRMRRLMEQASIVTLGGYITPDGTIETQSTDTEWSVNDRQGLPEDMPGQIESVIPVISAASLV